MPKISTGYIYKIFSDSHPNIFFCPTFVDPHTNFVRQKLMYEKNGRHREVYEIFKLGGNIQYEEIKKIESCSKENLRVLVNELIEQNKETCINKILESAYEKQKNRTKIWNREHADYIRNATKEWYKANKERSYKKIYLDNKEKHKEHMRNYMNKLKRCDTCNVMVKNIIMHKNSKKHLKCVENQKIQEKQVKDNAEQVCKPSEESSLSAKVVNNEIPKLD